LLVVARLVFHENSNLRKGFCARYLLLHRVRGVGRGVALRGQLGRMLFRKMVAHDAATDRADHRVMSRVVTGNAADDRAFQAACGMGGSGGAEGESGSEQGGLNIALFHIGIFLLGSGNTGILRRPYLGTAVTGSIAFCRRSGVNVRAVYGRPARAGETIGGLS
jgi:hypothetical protein